MGNIRRYRTRQKEQCKGRDRDNQRKQRERGGDCEKKEETRYGD